MKLALAAIVAAALTACGGGGGAPAQSTLATPQAGTTPATTAGSPVAPLAPVSVGEELPTPTPPADTPLFGAATPDPLAPSGRSLNWWGTEPQLLFDVQQTCAPRPDCMIPDGDLNLWNQQCPPVGNPYRAQCYVPLSFEEQVRPEDRRPLPPPLGMVRPDPMTATQAQADDWNQWCQTPRCLVVLGRQP